MLLSFDRGVSETSVGVCHTMRPGLKCPPFNTFELASDLVKYCLQLRAILYGKLRSQPDRVEGFLRAPLAATL